MDEAGGAPRDLPISRGTVVGRYVVLSMLGRGAMGTVYSALDPDLDRRVALKVVVPRVDERPRDLSREARVLARLEHPNVAAIHDVGFWNDRLFIAMELVDGGDLEHWLEQPRKPSEILAAFVQAGHGLAAAHARGVVHRDFKPSNVLIGADDRVRVADFGLARVSTEALATVTAGDPLRALITTDASAAGTPDFMAPELSTGGAATVLSDQYAFCVALCRGLAGTFPSGAHDAEALPLPAPARRTIARGLSADPADRFDSMEALLRTLERATRGRRARLAGGAAAIATAAILAAIALVGSDDATDCRTTLASWSERYSVQRADALQRSLAAAGPTYAKDSARRVTGALGHFGEAWSTAFERTCGDAGRTAELTCLERLRDRHDALWLALEQGADRFVEHAVPAVARLPQPAQCSAAGSALRPPMGPAEPDDDVAAGRVRARLWAAHALAETGQTARSLVEGRRALMGAQALGHPPLVAEALLATGVAQQLAGDSEAAQATLRRAATTAWGSGHDEAMLAALSHLVVVVGRDLGDEATAQVWSDLGHASVTRLAWPSPVEAEFLNAAGVLASGRGRWAQARQWYQRSLDLRRRLLPADHPHIVQSISNLATVDLEEGKFESALVRSREAMASLIANYGDDHPSVALGRGVLGLALLRNDRIDEAAVELKRGLEDAREALGPGHPRVASIANNLALVLDRRGEFRRSKALYLEALTAWRAVRGHDDPQVGVAHFNAGRAASRLGDHAEAIAHMRAALAIWTSTLGADHPRTATGLRGLSGALREAGACEEALVHAERARQVRATEAAPRADYRGHFSLGRAKACLDDFPGADTAIREAVALARGTNVAPSVVRTMLTKLADLKLRHGRVTEARATIEEALALGGNAPELAESELILARALTGSEPGRARTLALAALDNLPPDDLRYAATRAAIVAFVAGEATASNSALR